MEIDVDSLVFALTDNVIIDQGLGNDLPSVQAPLQFDIASDIDSDVDFDSPDVSAQMVFFTLSTTVSTWLP